MEYYNSLVTIVHENIGKSIAALVSLEGDQAFYVSHALIILTGLFILQYIIAFFSSTKGYSPSQPSQTKHFNNQFGNTATSKKRTKKNQLLICGPTTSGKTTLFYSLACKEVRTTVSSIEVNET